jgi:HEAT repeat protein
MTNRKWPRLLLGGALIVAFVVCVFSSYELIRCWQTTKAVKAVIPGDVAAIARFKPLLDDYNPWIRSDACEALGRIGPAAKAAAPELLAAMKDSAAQVRIHAAWALGEIDAGAPAIPALIEALDDEDSEVRRYAANALLKHGRLAEPAVAKLIERLQSDDPGAYMAAAALGEIGSPAKAAIPHLITALKKETGLLRAEYAQALGKFGPDARDAIPVLLPLTKDGDPDVSRIALAALKNIDPTVKAP